MKLKDGIYTRVTVVQGGKETPLEASPVIRAAMNTADECSRKVTGIEITVTSILDGKHKPGSKHYSGNAFDIRTHHYSGQEISFLVAELKKQLGNDFDVLFEVDHIHIEFDPK